VADIADASCASSTHCVLVGDRGQPGDPSDQAVASVTNDGISWQSEAEAGPAGDAGLTPPTTVVGQ
jgi:hypothetical protein